MKSKPWHNQGHYVLDGTYREGHDVIVTGAVEFVVLDVVGVTWEV